jgi:hypothetical protein
MRLLEQALTMTREKVDRVVDDLINHGFIRTVGSLSGGKHNPRLVVVDYPLRILAGTRGDSARLPTTMGYIWEDMVRQIIKIKNLPNLQVI